MLIDDYCEKLLEEQVIFEEIEIKPMREEFGYNNELTKQ